MVGNMMLNMIAHIAPAYAYVQSCSWSHYPAEFSSNPIKQKHLNQ